MSEKKLKEALKESTKQLKMMYDYAAYIRRQVMEDPIRPARITYITLDDLDEVMVQMSVNHKLLTKK